MIASPDLDDLTYDQITQQALAMIPAICPSWIDYNPSDPGITLIEMFSWLTEMVVYRINQVPPANRKAFLVLLNGPDWPTDAQRKLSLEELTRETVVDLRTIHRAVTLDDYQTLVLQQFPATVPASLADWIGRVRCLGEVNLDPNDVSSSSSNSTSSLTSASQVRSRSKKAAPPPMSSSSTTPPVASSSGATPAAAAGKAAAGSSDAKPARSSSSSAWVPSGPSVRVNARDGIAAPSDGSSSSSSGCAPPTAKGHISVVIVPSDFPVPSSSSSSSSSISSSSDGLSMRSRYRTSRLTAADSSSDSSLLPPSSSAVPSSSSLLPSSSTVPSSSSSSSPSSSSAKPPSSSSALPSSSLVPSSSSPARSSASSRGGLLSSSSSSSTNPTPWIPPEELLLAIGDFLNPLRLLTTHVHVVPPRVAFVSVSAALYLYSNASGQAVYNAATTDIPYFLHPLVGGGDGHGWPFNRNLYISDLYAQLQAVAGVNYVTGVEMTLTGTAGPVCGIQPGPVTSIDMSCFDVIWTTPADCNFQIWELLGTWVQTI